MVNKSEKELPVDLEILIEEIGRYFKVVPVFYDIVTVELTNKKNYNVFWYTSKKILEIYEGLIETYFKDEPENQSLLFLEVDSRAKSLHRRFPIPEQECKTQVNSSDFSESEMGIIEIPIELENFGKTIKREDEEKHLRNWQKCVLEWLELPFFSFSKIEFTIGKENFASAIWLGYEQSIKKSLYMDAIIEKFLRAYALNSISLEIQKEITLQATRAAISQVMARNMSHNMGSHVMSRLVTEESMMNYLNYSPSQYK